MTGRTRALDQARPSRAVCTTAASPPASRRIPATIGSALPLPPGPTAPTVAAATRVGPSAVRSRFASGLSSARAARLRRTRVNGEKPAEVGRRAGPGRCSIRERDRREHLHGVRLRPGAQVRRRVDRAVVAEVEKAVRVNLEMEMRLRRERVAGIADEPDHVPAVDCATVSRQPRVPGQMRVVEVVADVIHEPESPPADPVPADREDRPVGDGDDRRPERGEEIVAVVPAAGDVRPLSTVGVAPGRARADREGVRPAERRRP